MQSPNLPQNEPKAIPFITLTPQNKFEISPEASEFLSSLTSKKIGVISIAGKYRTGKSYFINKVLLNNNAKFKTGFQVGHTVNACTKGLLLWNQVIKASDFGGEQGLDLLIIDTEGFDATDESATHNTRIFLFAVLLSSLFIFNSKTTIDERAIESLELVVKLAQNLKFRDSGEENSEDVSRTFPAFIWVVRDFALEKKNDKGEFISEKQYLEKALEESKGFSDQAISKNRVRKSIKKFFMKRDCMTFSRPAEREEDLRNLDLLADSELRDKFLVEIRRAKEVIFKTAKTKLFAGNEVSAGVFYQLALSLVDIINSGQVPNIEQIGFSAYQESLRMSFSEAQKMAEKMINEAVVSGKLLGEERENIEKATFLVLKENSIGDKKLIKEFRVKLSGFLNSLFLKRKNEQLNGFEKIVRGRFETENFKWRNDLKTKVISDISELKNTIDIFQTILNEEFKDNFEIKAFIANLRIENEKEIFLEIFERQKDNERKRKQHFEEINLNFENSRREVKFKEQELEDLKIEKGNLERVNKNLKIQIDSQNCEAEKIQIILEEKKVEIQKTQIEEKLKQQKLENEWMIKLENLKKEESLIFQQKDLEMSNLKRELTVKTATAESYKSELKKKDQESEENQHKIDQLKTERKELIEKSILFENLQTKSESEILELKKQIESKERKIVELTISKQTQNDRIEMFKNQNENMKTLYENFIANVGEKKVNSENENVNDLLYLNKNLSNSMKKMEQTNKFLEDRVSELKNFKRIFKNCENVQCPKCSKCVDRNFFLLHVKDCQDARLHRTDSVGQFVSGISRKTGEERKIGSTRDKPLLSVYVKIKDSKTITIGKEHFIEYALSVYHNDDKIWIVRKRYRDFSGLIIDLKKENQSLQLPKSAGKIIGTNLGEDLNKIKKSHVEDRKKLLEDCVNDLAKLVEVKTSLVFARFLEIENGRQSRSVQPINSMQLTDKKKSRDKLDKVYDSGDNFLDESEGEELSSENKNTGIENKIAMFGGLKNGDEVGSFKGYENLKGVVLNKVNLKVSLPGRTADL